MFKFRVNFITRVLSSGIAVYFGGSKPTFRKNTSSRSLTLKMEATYSSYTSYDFHRTKRVMFPKTELFITSPMRISNTAQSLYVLMFTKLIINTRISVRVCAFNNNSENVVTGVTSFSALFRHPVGLCCCLSNFCCLDIKLVSANVHCFPNFTFRNSKFILCVWK